MTFSNPRIGLAGGAHGKGGMKRVVKRASTIKEVCSATEFYTSPKAGEKIDVSKPITFKWNTTCLEGSLTYVDVYLYAPHTNKSLVQVWSHAAFAAGELKTTLEPVWWGNDANVDLQISLAEYASPTYLDEFPAGPVFSAKSDGTTVTSGSTSQGDDDSASIYQRVKDAAGKMSPGATAAAVLLPLLFVIGLIVFFVRRARAKRSAETKRFSQAVDKRMSTVSTNWRSMSGAGGNAAMRNSHFGNIQSSEDDLPQMEQARLSGAGERISRISFIEPARPSADRLHAHARLASAASHGARSYHAAQTPEYDDEIVNRELNMSPTQTEGPELLLPGEIASRVSSERDMEFEREVMGMPAITLMRTASPNGSQEAQYILHPGAPAPPPAARVSPTFQTKSQFSAQPMMSPRILGSPMPSNEQALSPDDMLKEYAAGRTPMSPAAGSVSSQSGMRVKYKANEHQHPAHTADVQTSRYSDVSAYSGMDQ